MNDQKEPLPDYREDPDAYELEQRSRPDEMRMVARVGEYARQELSRFSSGRVLDICCGTGMSLESLVGHRSLHSALGLDICSSYLDYARRRFSGVSEKFKFVLGDAVDARLERMCFEVVILCSAYHHIEDSRKNDLLVRVYDLLAPKGVAIMAENVLPPYGSSPGSYEDAVRIFYEEVLATAEECNPDLPDRVRGLIKRVAQYGCDGEYEFKTSLSVLKSHLSGARLRVKRWERVWSAPSLGGDAGNFVFLLEKEDG